MKRIAVAVTLFSVAALALGTGLYGGVGAFDDGMLAAFRDGQNLNDAAGPAMVENFLRDLSAIGSFPILAMLVIGSSLLLAATGERALAARYFLIAAAGWGVSHVLKLVFERARPDAVPHLTHVGDASMPSGHSMNSAIIFLTLAAVASLLTTNASVQRLMFGFAILLSALTGFSRIYLGVHYPTDVLAGWVLGCLWAAAAWQFFEMRTRSVA